MRALTTDLYQLTMAQGYWLHGRHRDEASFYLSFRRLPFGGGFAIAAGLGPVVEFLQDLRFQPEEIDYLRSLNGADGRPLFRSAFVEALPGLDLRVSLAAVPEGTAVFPGEPLLRVEGPLLAGQLVESAILNLVNFQTLIATKAARICHIAAIGQEVMEFGLRRAQGLDGALSASRAAYIGGCVASSNAEAGLRFGMPVRGTHAHSWVQAFGSEPRAFGALAAAMPNNCVLVVDTYDVDAGVEHAIAVGHRLRASGQRLLGVRLDSGDLLQQSRRVRRRLDEVGLEDVAIVATDNLDEERILELRRAGAAIDTWGVGTRLVTAAGEGAFGGVYKLSAIRRAGANAWRPVCKLGAGVAAVKASLPGRLQARRFALAGGTFERDVVYGADLESAELAAAAGAGRDLLRPVLEQGELVAGLPSLGASRDLAAREIATLPAALRVLNCDAPPAVTVVPELLELRRRLTAEQLARTA